MSHALNETQKNELRKYLDDRKAWAARQEEKRAEVAAYARRLLGE